MINTSYIYCLVDPRTDDVRYVGMAKDVRHRVWQHMYYNRGGSHKVNWINALKRADLEPRAYILEVCRGDEWKEAEVRWISHYRTVGLGLTNATDGGDGVTGFKCNDEQRERRASVNRGRVRSDEFKKKVSAALSGRAPKAAIAARMATAAKKRQFDKEERERKALNSFGRGHTWSCCVSCRKPMPAGRVKQHLHFNPECTTLYANVA